MAAAHAAAASAISPIAALADVERIEREPLRLPFETTYGAFERAAELYGDRPALQAIELDASGRSRHLGTLSHRELLHAIARIASLLEALGVEPRTPVAIVMNNHIETHLALWGAEAIAIACPINPLLDPVHIAGILRSIGAKVLVTEANNGRIPATVAAALREAPQVEHLLTINPSGERIDSAASALPPSRLKVHVAPPLSSLRARFTDFRTTAAAATHSSYLHTGGTTGAPKVAMRTHLNETSQAWLFGGLAGFEETDVVLCGLPLFHTNAMLVTGLAPLSRGACVLLASSRGYRNPQVIQRFWSIAREYGVTHFSGVPTIYSRLLETFDAPAPSLKLGICGAAPMPAELLDRFQRTTGAQVVEGYGLTEGGCVSALNPVAGQRQLGSVGIRIPHQQIKAVKIDSNAAVCDCAPGETGVLAIKGPNVFAGYVDADHNKGTILPDGWLLTGDLGRIEADGFIFLQGRAKDVIIRGGHNIDPSLAEAALHRHVAVALAAVVGQPHKDLGEVPVAFVTLQPGTSIDPEILLDYARKHTGERAAAPTAIHIVDALPVTAVGKIFKPELRRRAAELAIREELRAQDLSSSGLAVELDRHGQVVCDLSGVAASALPALRRLLGQLNLRVRSPSVAP